MPRIALFPRAVLLAAGASVFFAVTTAALPAVAAEAAHPPVTAGAASPADPAAPASPADPDAPRIEWGVVPADADGPDGRISLRHVLDPGAVVSDAVAVTNHSIEPAVFAVATGDGTVGADGAYDVRTDAPVGGGAWISVEGLDTPGDGALTLEAGETRVLPVTIAVPADATPGDHPAGVVVGLSDTDEGVTVTHRVGVRLHLQVAGEIDPRLSVSQATAVFAPSWVPFAPGTLTVHYRVTNDGNVRLGASGEVAASGPFGWNAIDHRADTVELLPGASAEHSVDLPLMALFSAAGEVRVDAVALGDDEVSLPAAVTAEIRAFAAPWAEIALVIVATGLVVLVVVAVRRGRGRTQRRIDAAIAADRALR